MAYNTGNPLGSSDFKDLSDNAVNFDKYSNGTDPAYQNRFGALKLSIEGMNQQFASAQEGRAAEFDAFLAAAAFVFIGDYGAGLNFTSRSQYMVRDGVPYRIAPSTTLPYTTTGNWTLEVDNFTPISGDDVLRQDLVASDGAGLVGYSAAASYPAGTIGYSLRNRISVKDAPFSAVGDGVADDTAAIQAAVDFASANGGGLVRIPAGDYKTTSAITVTSNFVKLEGDGIRVTRIKPSTVGQNCFVFGDGVSILQYCGLSELGIMPTAVIGTAITVKNHYWFAVEKVMIAGNHAIGLNAWNGDTAAYLLILRDLFTLASTEYGLLLGRDGTGSLQNVLMYNCHLDGADVAGLRAENVSGLIWIGGESLTCSRAVSLVPKASGTVRACLFQGLFLDTSDNEVLYTAIGDNTRRISTVGFVNCSFNASVVNVGAFLGGLSTDSSRMDKIRFTSCEFSLNHSHGLFAQYCRDVDVISCNFISNGVTSGNGVVVSAGVNGFKMIGGSSGGGSGFPGNFQDYGVQISAAATNVLISGVNVQNNDVAGIDNQGASNTKIRDCQGYKTRASGTGTMPTGGSVAITHGLAAAPVAVLITPTADPQVRYWVTSFNTSTFLAACNVTPAAAWGFVWEAWTLQE